MQRIIISKISISIISTLAISTLALTGCQQSLPQSPHSALAIAPAEPFYAVGYEPQQHNVNLSSYVEQLVVSLQQQSEPPHAGTIAVASFVDFDATLTNSHALGNQLAENFITQLRRYGFTVADTKVSKQLTTTAQGDFIFSRKARRLVRKNPLTSVLAGTLIYTPRGIEVNTRIIDLSNQKVLTTAAITIPYFVVNHLGQPQ